MVCAGYSMASGLVEFKTVLLYNREFSKYSLLWMLSYLSSRKQFVLINDKRSNLPLLQFGLHRGQVVFNLYVADLQERLQCPCFDNGDTIFNAYCKPAEPDHVKVK